MADPEIPGPEGEDAVRLSDVGDDVGAVAGAAAAGASMLVQGGGIIEAARVMSQTLEMNQMINDMQTELHDMQMQIIDNLDANAGLEVIDAAQAPAFDAGEGQVAGFDADGFDDVTDT